MGKKRKMKKLPYPFCETTENLIKVANRLNAELSFPDLPLQRQRECQVLLRDIKVALNSRMLLKGNNNDVA